MSETGWRSFLAAEGVDDWVVLHGGATAAFAVDSLAQAASLGKAICDLPELVGNGALVTLTDRRVSVRLTRDLWLIEDHHVNLARAVSTASREFGARAERSAVQEVQLAVAARPDDVDLPFWRAVLGYQEAADDNAVDGLGHSSTVWMQPLDADRPLRHAMHIDVSVAREEAEARVAAALAVGGRIIADAEAPATWILSDRAGNRVCVASWPDGAEPGAAGH